MLQVIGAGFGRTGTLSLKAALERLLGAPCYHMAEVFAHLDHAPAWTAALGALWEMAIEVITKRSFGADEYRSLHEDDFKAAYERHNDEVRRTAPADRFLDFDVVQGWEPLCAFLGVDVPDEPFPNVNDR